MLVLFYIYLIKFKNRLTSQKVLGGDSSLIAGRTTNLLCGGQWLLGLGEGDDALDVDAGLVAERGGEPHHPLADAGAGAGGQHALHGGHALAQHEEGHRLGDGAGGLHEPADQHGAAQQRGGAEVADPRPRAAGDGLRLRLLRGDVAVVARRGVLLRLPGVGLRMRMLLSLVLRRRRRLLGPPGVLLLLLLAGGGVGGGCQVGREHLRRGGCTCRRL